MGVIWRKVWFDLWHNKVRTSPAVLSIAAGVFAIGAVFGMVDQLLGQGLGQIMFDANLDYRYDLKAMLIWLVIILVISTLAALLPARSATQVSVRERLAYV